MNKALAQAEGRRSYLRAAVHGARQWRLGFLWTLTLLLPTAVASWPLWRALAAALDFSPRVAVLAQRIDLLAFSDLLVVLGRSGPALGGAATLATLLLLLLSPLLSGMMVTAAHTEDRLSITALLQGGVALYGRMFRLLLVSLLPLLLIGAATGGAFKVAGKHAEQVFLDAHAQRARWIATVLGLLVFWVLHATIEAARGQLASDRALRSAWRALFRSIRMLGRRPLMLLGLYLLPTLLSLLLATLLFSLRIRTSAATSGGLAAGLLFTQLAVAVIGLGRVSRLYALTALCRDSAPTSANPREGAPPAHAHASADLASPGAETAANG